MKYFKPEDFMLDPTNAKAAADAANRKLAKLLEEAPVVYSAYDDTTENVWYSYGGTRAAPEDNFKARLLCVEPIVKEPCKEHIPRSDTIRSGVAICLNCDKTIFEKWEAK